MMTEPLEREAVRRFREASRRVVRELDLLRSAHGRIVHTTTECHVLIEIEAAPLRAVNDLAAVLRLDPASLSRVLRGLVDRGLVHLPRDRDDARRKSCRLTARGRRELQGIHADADRRVQASLATLTTKERDSVLHGMELYAQALLRSRAREGFSIRSIEAKDDAAIACVIRRVIPEFGAVGTGHSIHDPEVGAMSAAYAAPGAAYFVLTRRGRVVGGGGIAPLRGGEPGTCELRKMYFLPEVRGRGFGQLLLERCLAAASERGYRYCYLETIERMAQARALYEKNGFVRLCGPRGRTGHSACDTWYGRELSGQRPAP